MGLRRWKVITFNVIVAMFIALVHQDSAATVLVNVLGAEWPRGFVSFLRQNTEGLVAAMAISLLFEFTRPDELKRYLRSRRDESDALITDLLTNTGSHQLIRMGLKDLLDAEAASALLTTITSPLPPFHDCSVDYKIEACDDGTQDYIFRWRMEFTADIDEFLFAVVNRNSVSEALLASVPKLIEAFNYHDGRDLSGLTTTEGLIKVREILRNSDGSTSSTPLALRRVPPRNLRQYYPAGGVIEDRAAALFTHTFSSAARKKPRRLVMEATSRCSASENYTYWICPRTTQLRRFTIDASDLLRTNPGIRFSLHPCLGIYRSVDEQSERTGRVFLEVNSWILRGHGAFLTWMEAP